MGTTDVDLTIDVTTLSGLVALTVHPFDPMVACTVGRAPDRIVACSGLWNAGNASVTASGIRIRAADPCGNANSTSCNATAVWRTGPYYGE